MEGVLCYGVVLPPQLADEIERWSWAEEAGEAGKTPKLERRGGALRLLF